MVADLREDAEDYQEAVKTALDGRVARIQTGMPGIIVSVSGQTATVQPAIQAMVQDPTGTRTPLTISQIPDVPLQFPGGGGATMTFPVAPGDEVWLSFSSRSLDTWWANGGVGPPPHPRQHDITDAVAHLGFRSKPRALSGISTTSAQLRSDDGSTFVEIANGQLVNIVAPAGVTITTPVLRVVGQIQATLEVTAKAGSAGYVTLSGHHGHTNNLIPPTPGT